MNVISYLEWRGDISITRLPLCEADYAVLGCCSYFPFDGIVPGDFDSVPVSMWSAVNRMRELESLDGDGRCYHYKEDTEMTAQLLVSPRFTSLDLIGFRNKIDESRVEQFSALTVLMPGKQTVVVFRGTDRTLTGWKEDFNMVYLEHVPSQEDALKYLEEAAEHTTGDIFLCGHSKGGNLAVYSAAHCSEKTRIRIKEIVNLDGPGFSKEELESPGFLSIRDRVRSFIPQQSIVGMLLEHSVNRCVIHSSKAAFWQHSIYSWEIQRGEFIRETNIKTLSRKLDETMKNWLTSMDRDTRGKVIEGFWSVVEGSGADNTEDLFTFRSTMNIMKKMGKIDDETREIMRETVKLFMKAFKKMQTDNREQKRENRRKKNAIDIQGGKV